MSQSGSCVFMPGSWRWLLREGWDKSEGDLDDGAATDANQVTWFSHAFWFTSSKAHLTRGLPSPLRMITKLCSNPSSRAPTVEASLTPFCGLSLLSKSATFGASDYASRLGSPMTQPTVSPKSRSKGAHAMRSSLAKVTYRAVLSNLMFMSCAETSRRLMSSSTDFEFDKVLRQLGRIDLGPRAMRS
jgi:hypothetical protein